MINDRDTLPGGLDKWGFLFERMDFWHQMGFWRKENIDVESQPIKTAAMPELPIAEQQERKGRQ